MYFSALHNRHTQLSSSLLSSSVVIHYYNKSLWKSFVMHFISVINWVFAPHQNKKKFDWNVYFRLCRHRTKLLLLLLLK